MSKTKHQSLPIYLSLFLLLCSSFRAFSLQLCAARMGDCILGNGARIIGGRGRRRRTNNNWLFAIEAIPSAAAAIALKFDFNYVMIELDSRAHEHRRP